MHEKAKQRIENKKTETDTRPEFKLLKTGNKAEQYIAGVARLGEKLLKEKDVDVMEKKQIIQILKTIKTLRV